jgi:hypothetical protein
MPEDRTDQLLSSWDTKAERRGLERGEFGYWSAGTDWTAPEVDDQPGRTGS